MTRWLSRAYVVWRRDGFLAVLRRARMRLALALGRAQDEGSFPYNAWIAENEPDDAALDVQRVAADRLAPKPLFSVLPCPPPADRRALRALIQSLERQTYTNWELVLPPEVTARARHAGAIVPRPRGEWLVLLSRGARLAPDALYEAARRLGRGDADALYGDHDLLDAVGRRTQPFFKPEFSPELLLSTDYFAPAFLIRASLLATMPSPRTQAEHWDIALQVAEQARYIAHLPRVLASATHHGDAESGRAPVAACLARRGLDAHAEVNGAGCLRVRWSAPPASVGVVIPTRDGVGHLRSCLDSLARTKGRLEIVIVDNGSTDPATLRFLADNESAGRMRVLRQPGPFNWAALNNCGARACESEVLAFLNDDVEALSEDWLEELVRWAMLPAVGVAGGLLVRPDGTVQHAGVALGLGGLAAHPFEGQREDAQGPLGAVRWYRNWLAVTGACQVLRREVFNVVGGFDESFTALFSDVEFCLRCWRHGLRIVFTPFARLLHHHGTTRGGDERMPPHDFIIARERFSDLLTGGDPYFNPNLSRWSAVPTLRRRGETDAMVWLEALTALLAERFPGDRGRLPQPIAPLASEVAARLRGLRSTPR